MTRTFGRSLVAAAAAALLIAPSAFAAKGFSYGVTAGEVSSSSAILWGHANRGGRYSLEVARDRRFRSAVAEVRVRATRGNDFTVQRRVGRLAPGRRYWYRFTGTRGRKSDTGTFVTAPRRGRNAKLEFAFTGDTDFTPEPGKTTPYWNSGGVFARMRAERNHFNVHLGDTIYSDSEVPGALHPIALTVPAKWTKYKVNLANRHLRAVRRSAGFFSHWDDHEFVNDFSPNESTFSNDVNIDGRTLYRRGVRAFRDYAPVRWSSRNGIYRTLRWGRNAELFFLDQRSFRSAKADEGGVCDNPQTGEPDLAPTGPQSSRALFAVLVPSLAAPVSQACLDAIRSPDRTYLGKRQLTRFLRAVRRSSARFKIVMNELPIQQYYSLPYDRWEGYEAERQKVLRSLRSVKNVIFLTTDVHATLVNDARLQTLEPGGPKNTGILDVTVGPAATANFSLEIDGATGRPGSGPLVDQVFHEASPQNGGVGMQCSVIDRFSYGQVSVSATQLVVTPKGIGGEQLRNGSKPCGPFVLNYER
ncbi:MAG TPA: alkaline phosphatase D family protein [Thermoleophilaceae bacterium]|nr:alkaline phosphatase D family protein [Thermoleophilaceae bacterium]